MRCATVPLIPPVHWVRLCTMTTMQAEGRLVVPTSLNVSYAGVDQRGFQGLVGFGLCWKSWAHHSSAGIQMRNGYYTFLMLCFKINGRRWFTSLEFYFAAKTILLSAPSFPADTISRWSEADLSFSLMLRTDHSISEMEERSGIFSLLYPLYMKLWAQLELMQVTEWANESFHGSYGIKPLHPLKASLNPGTFAGSLMKSEQSSSLYVEKEFKTLSKGKIKVKWTPDPHKYCLTRRKPYLSHRIFTFPPKRTVITKTVLLGA